MFVAFGSVEAQQAELKSKVTSLEELSVESVPCISFLAGWRLKEERSEHQCGRMVVVVGSIA